MMKGYSVWEEIKYNEFNYNEYRRECQVNTDRVYDERAVMIEVCRDILEELNRE